MPPEPGAAIAEQESASAPPQGLARVSGSTRLPAWRAVLSFPVVLGLTLTVLTVLTVRNRFSDPDLWWHLKTGEIIWNTHTIPRADLFSFTTNNHPWTAHEWLSEVFLYATWKFGGYSGLMLWLCVFATLLFVGQYVVCWLYSGNAKVALLGGLVAWFFGTVGLGVRPQILGYLLLTCELLIVHLARSRNPRFFLLLPPLFAVWVNCHGSFFLGLMVLGIFLVCSRFHMRAGLLVATRWETPQRNMLAAAFVLSLAALFANPVGYNLLLYPMDVMLHQPKGLQYVTEWQALKFDEPRALAMAGVTGFIFVWALARRAKLRLEELLLLGLGFGMAALHFRMLFVFGMLAAPVMCRLLAGAWDRYEPARDRWALNAIIILISLISVFFAFPTAEALDAQVRKDSPVKAVEFIRRTGLSGRMLNDYVFGGYLIWALPEHKVFVDGRADVYDWTGVMGEFGAWATLQTDSRVLLDKYRIDFCLMSRNAPMSHVLPLLPGWKTIYSDEVSIIFAKSGAPGWKS